MLYILCILTNLTFSPFSAGPIPMMVGAELFRQGPRPRAMSLAGLTNWLFTLVVAISFELIQVRLGAYQVPYNRAGFQLVWKRESNSKCFKLSENFVSCKGKVEI